MKKFSGSKSKRGFVLNDCLRGLDDAELYVVVWVLRLSWCNDER